MHHVIVKIICQNVIYLSTCCICYSCRFHDEGKSIITSSNSPVALWSSALRKSIFASPIKYQSVRTLWITYISYAVIENINRKIWQYITHIHVTAIAISYVLLIFLQQFIWIKVSYRYDTKESNSVSFNLGKWQCRYILYQGTLYMYGKAGCVFMCWNDYCLPK